MVPLHGPARVVLVTAFAGLVSGCLLDSSAYDSAGSGGVSGTGTTAGGGGPGGSGTGNGGSGAGSSAGGATGGAGGATGGTTASGGTTTTTTPPECTKDADCPDPGGMCVAPKCDKGVCAGKPDNDNMVCGIAMGECYDTAKCDAGSCVSAPLASGEPLSDFSLGDCNKPVCDGNGTRILVPDDGDKPFNTQCADFACGNGSVMMTPKNEGEGCLIGGVCCANGLCCDASCSLCL